METIAQGSTSTEPPRARVQFCRDVLMAPDQTFDAPADLTDDPDLTIDQKVALLEAWRDLERRRLRAGGESETGPSGARETAARLRSVERELSRLGGARSTPLLR